MIPKQL